jgi:gas vesicle protein
MSISTTPIASSSQASAAALAQAKATKTTSKQEDKFSFWDLVDVVNPLQHIPVVNNIYRKVTGDEIGSVARVAGGVLFGGVVGGLLGGANAIAAHESNGKDLSEIALNKMGVMESDTKVAEKETAQEETVTASVDKELPKTSGGIPDELRKAAGLPIAAPAVPSALPLVEVRPMAEASAVEEKAVTLGEAQQKQKDQLVSKDAEQTIEVASALPSAKELNDLEPGSIPVQDPKKVDVNQSMMEALAKYQAMEKVTPPGTVTTVAEGEKAKLFKNMRRY